MLGNEWFRVHPFSFRARRDDAHGHSLQRGATRPWMKRGVLWIRIFKYHGYKGVVENGLVSLAGWYLIFATSCANTSAMRRIQKTVQQQALSTHQGTTGRWQSKPVSPQFDCPGIQSKQISNGIDQRITPPGQMCCYTFADKITWLVPGISWKTSEKPEELLTQPLSAISVDNVI